MTLLFNSAMFCYTTYYYCSETANAWDQEETISVCFECNIERKKHKNPNQNVWQEVHLKIGHYLDLEGTCISA
jgi:hypothetical protein